MKCPVCDVALLISSREGVEIDHCPQCRGVWLDRGELDKIIDRAGAAVGARSTRGDWDDDRRGADRPSDDRSRYDADRDRDRDRDWDDRRGPRRKRRGSFLEDLFDFD